MADAQIAIIDGDQTQVVLAPGENPAIVTSIPGPQGPAGAGVPLGGTTNQVLFKQSGTNYDTAWGPITSAMIGDLEIVNADVSASAAIAGTKISPNFGSQNVVTTGTSTAASFIPSSSTVPTNGLYLSAANSVALSTNGQGRLFVDPNGKIGIATSSPDVDLHLGITPLSTGSAGVIGFGDIGGYRMAEIEGIRQDGSFAGSLIFRTQTAGSSGFSGAERLRITSTGQLSHIGAGSSGSPAVSFSGSAASNSLVVDSSSRVGIGTSGPSALLDIRSSALNSSSVTTTTLNQAVQLRITGTSNDNVTGNYIAGLSLGETSNQCSAILAYDDGGLQAAGLRFITGNSTAVAPRLSIDSAGRVGIGTTSPGELLDISPSTEAGAILLGRIPYATHGSFLVGNGLLANHVTKAGNSTVNVSSCKIDFGNGPIIFSTSPGAAAGVARTYTETARITSSGQLLVGTSSARSNFYNGALTNRFQVEGTTFETSGASYTCNNAVAGEAPIISLNKSAGGSVGSNTIVSSGHILGLLTFQGNDGTQFVQAADIKAEVDGTPGADDMPGRLVFSTTADGASSPTERMRINNAGTTTLTSAAATAPFIAKISTTETARIDSSGRLLVGTSSVSGLNAAKTVISETSAVAAQRIVGNSNTQGAAQKITVVRHYPVVSLGTKLVIPIVSQSNLNISTLCKVWGLGARYNSATPLPFEINFAFGHSTSISNLASWGGQGNYSSIAANGMSIEITFTTAYTNATADGVYVCLEYITPRPDDSVNVASIAMN